MNSQELVNLQKRNKHKAYAMALELYMNGQEEILLDAVTLGFSDMGCAIEYAVDSKQDISFAKKLFTVGTESQRVNWLTYLPNRTFRSLIPEIEQALNFNQVPLSSRLLLACKCASFMEYIELEEFLHDFITAIEAEPEELRELWKFHSQIVGYRKFPEIVRHCFGSCKNIRAILELD